MMKKIDKSPLNKCNNMIQSLHCTRTVLIYLTCYTTIKIIAFNNYNFLLWKNYNHCFKSIFTFNKENRKSVKLDGDILQFQTILKLSTSGLSSTENSLK